MPIYTNKYNIPEPFVRVVTGYQTRERHGDISITELIKPPQMLEIERQYDQRIIIDVSDLLWSLDGQLAHEALRRAGAMNALQEENMTIRVAGWTISGTPDLYQTTDSAGRLEVLTDWKRTSVWAIVYRSRIAEWTAQLNLYALLFERAGFPVRHLQTTVMLRDWDEDKANADREKGGNYPLAPVLNIPLDLWTDEFRTAFLRKRVSLHKRARLQKRWAPCDPSERWVQGEAWAVMRRKRKRATSVLDNPKAARDRLAEIEATGVPRKELHVEHRPGVFRRCARYCDVGRNGFCPQLQAERGMRVAS